MSTRHIPSTRRARRTAVFVAATMLLASCSGDDDTDPAASDDAADLALCETGPGFDATTIRIGGLYPTTGPEGQFFGAVGAGIEARLAAENDAGGVGGRQLELIHADDGDGEIANSGASEYLVETEDVFGMIEVSTSGEGGAEYLHDNDIPVVGWAITASWGRLDNMFGYRHSTTPDPTDIQPVSRGVPLAQHRGATKLAVVAGGTSAAIRQAQVAEATAESLGLEVVYSNHSVPLGAQDFRIEAQHISDAGADSVYLALQTQGSMGLLGALRAAQVPLDVIIMGAGYDARLPQAYGQVIAGALIPIDWRPFELPVPAHDSFRTWLAEVDPDAYPGQLAMVGWLSADVFIRGLNESGVGCPSRTGFIDGLRSVTDHTADGLLPPTDYGEVFGHPPQCFWYVEVVGSEFAPVDDEPLCSLEIPDGFGGP